MTLVVFPGAADPKTTYKDVYHLLKKKCKSKGWSFKLKAYPGHFSYDKHSYLSMASIVRLIHSTIVELEKKEEEYVVMCRSFGCLPFIEFLKHNSLEMKFAKKVILWGVSPYYQWYNNLGKDFDPHVFKVKRVRVKPELFGEIYPVELSINEIRQDYSFKIYITSGDDDLYHPKYFQEMLKEINENPNVILSKMVKGEGHSIVRYNKEYFNLIFS